MHVRKNATNLNHFKLNFLCKIFFAVDLCIQVSKGGKKTFLDDDDDEDDTGSNNGIK